MLPAPHGDHHRFTGVARCRQRRADLFRGGDTAAGAVDPQDYRPDRRVETRLADLGCGGITTYAARRRLTIDDRAAGKNNGDLTITSTLRFQGIVIDADMAVIARACIPAKLPGQNAFGLAARCQPIDQPV